MIVILSGFLVGRITVFEPKALKELYFGEEIKYSVMNFGKIPYGYSVTGMVHIAVPNHACTDLRPINFDKSLGALILLVDRGICNFAEKVLNAQKVGADLVLIVDNNTENVHKIFPVERTKSVLDQVHIPSLLLSKIDGDQLKIAIELQTVPSVEDAYRRPVEMTVHFELSKSTTKAHVRVILQVDDFQSYDLLTEFYEFYGNYKQIIDVKVHFKVFLNAELPFKNDECVMSGLDTYCVVKSQSDDREVPGLISETIRQMCLYNFDFGKFANYAAKIRKSCFSAENLVVTDFQNCANEIYLQEVNEEDRKGLRECMKFGSTENEIMMQNNYEETKYFLINYSPLIFIYGF